MNTTALEELKRIFAHEINYSALRTTDPINPLTYLTPEGDNCLMIAAIRGDTRAIELLLDLGIDINAQGDMGNTALHYAKNFDRWPAYELLIRRGAAKNIINEFGETPT